MGLMITLVLVMTYVALLGYTSPATTTQDVKGNFERNRSVSSRSLKPSSSLDDIPVKINRRQSRGRDEFVEDNFDNQEIPSGSLSQRPRVVYVDRTPAGFDDSMNAFVQHPRANRPSSHPDGDILTGRRERPYDDPVGLRAQQEEVQSRNYGGGFTSFISRILGRSTSNRPQTAEDYLYPSEPSRYSDNMQLIPPVTPSTRGNVVGSIIRALLQK